MRSTAVRCSAAGHFRYLPAFVLSTSACPSHPQGDPDLGEHPTSSLPTWARHVANRSRTFVTTRLHRPFQPQLSPIESGLSSPFVATY